jgi:hypothetical protein
MNIIKLMTVTLNAFVIRAVIKRFNKGIFTIYDFVNLVFEIFFVFPLLLDVLLGYPNLTTFPGFHLSQDDILTSVIYCIFSAVVPCFFDRMSRKSKYKTCFSDVMVASKWLGGKPVVNMLLLFGCFLPVVTALVSPDPLKYFCDFAPFMRDKFSLSYIYHNEVMRPMIMIAILSILALYAITDRKRKGFVFMAYVATFFVGWFAGKRTMVAFLILGLTVINMLKEEKNRNALGKLILGAVVIFSYSFMYQLVVRDISLADFEYTYANFRIDYGRDDEMKMTIYALLHPNEIKILEFPGQSYLYDLTFFVRRENWPNKPWPYAVYFTSALLRSHTVSYIGWGMTTSWFGEAVANFGWLGLPFGVLSFAFFIKVSERKQNMIVTMISIAVLSCLMVLQFSAVIKLVTVWILAIVLLRTGEKQDAKSLLASFSQGEI